MDTRTYEERKEYYKQWAERNPEKVKEQAHRKYLKNREHKLAKNKEWWAAHPNWEKEHRPDRKTWQREKRAKRRLVNFGIPSNEHEAILTRFEKGPCAICGCLETSRWHMDHDHATGKFRDILCDACNKGLGCFRDNPWILLAAAKYLDGA